MADKYIAAVFPNGESAREGLHALWRLDTDGDVNVHGAVLVRRDKFGEIVVVQKDTNAPWRTAAGLALGALIGAFAGPAGAAAGAARGAAIGAAAGGVVGVAADVAKADTNKQALVDSAEVLPIGRYAVIAEIGRAGTSPLTAPWANWAAKSIGAPRATFATTSGTTTTPSSTRTTTNPRSSARYSRDG